MARGVAGSTYPTFSLLPTAGDLITRAASSPLTAVLLQALVYDVTKGGGTISVCLRRYSCRGLLTSLVRSAQ